MSELDDYTSEADYTVADGMVIESPPVVGEHVHYRLSEQDAASVNVRRRDFQAFQRSHAHPHEPGQPGAIGHVAHVGNEAREGDVCAATIVRVFDPGTDTVNLQVHLDGNDTYWATSRTKGDQPGNWTYFTV
jgi:hypothetical protein